MEALLGSTLLVKDGNGSKSVPTAEALKDADVVGLYFSAHWCPPCRGFAPVLAKKRDELQAAGKRFEVVFVSSDRSEADFNEYYGEQPWRALPFADRERKGKLSSKFKVQGIPTLVLLNNSDASVITLKGREAVMTEEYPFTPPTVASVFQDTLALTNAAGTEETFGSVRARTDYIGLYFSAHWCPPCRKFTPELGKRYATVKEQGKKFEIIFLSSDRDDASFKEYLSEMPWLAATFDAPGKAAKAAASSLFEVEGIPSFVMLDSKDLSIVNKDARGPAGGDKKCEKFPWAPPLVGNLDEDPSGINETPTVVVLFEDAPDQWDDVQDAMNEVAAEVKAECKAKGEDPDIIFKYCEEDHGLNRKVRELAGLGQSPTPDKVEITLLNIPEGQVLQTPQTACTAADFRALVAGFRAGTVEMRSLGPP